MNKTETFIENHTLSVIISLILIILCCFTTMFFIKPSGKTNRAMSNELYISNENGERLSYNISKEDEALYFAEIYLNNAFPLCSGHEYRIMNCGEGKYIIYCDTVADSAFDDYYRICPAASITSSGTVNLHIYRILYNFT